MSRIRDSHRISWATTERWVHQRYSLRVSHQAERVAPKVLGIDEHFFTRKDGYATTFANLVTHRVFDVQLGRSALALQRYLDELPGKEHTEVVLMDLSETYRSIVRRHFPNAKIVADRSSSACFASITQLSSSLLPIPRRLSSRLPDYLYRRQEHSGATRTASSSTCAGRTRRTGP